MTAPARISQADMDRAAKSLVNAGIERARIVMDLANAKIEIIIGSESDAPRRPSSAWDADREL